MEAFNFRPSECRTVNNHIKQLTSTDNLAKQDTEICCYNSYNESN